MKKLIIIAIVIISTGKAHSQKFWMMDMDVQSIEFDGFHCYKDISVIFGTRNDTAAFMFDDRMLMYSAKFDLKDFTSLRRRQIDQYIKDNKHSVLMIDHRNEFYMITVRINEDTGQILISITNIDYGIPSYVFSFGTNLCE